MAAQLAYLDSCVVIYLVEGLAPVSLAVNEAIRHQAADQGQIAISDLTRLECRVGPLRNGDLKTLALYDSFFESSDLVHLPIDPRVFDLATELRAKNRLKTPDALHLATALIFDCAEFWTNDRRLTAASKKRIRLRTLP